MNDLIVRRTPSTELPALSALHPLRTLRELLTWDPFQEMAPMLPVDVQKVIPPFEVREMKDRFVFQADLPGVEVKDIEILLTGNRLTIIGTRLDKVEKGEEGEYYARERFYGRFTRSFTLPEGADLNAVQAHLASGVLTIVFPKVPAVQPKKIPVTVEKVAKV
ncbi:MAG: Hsp20/alpha crystallin family protein [Myxococcaceae bacterium]|nr:MAG: Hsp20/alpha crystallin family protein [Myxococcaceae bacterium]